VKSVLVLQVKTVGEIMCVHVDHLGQRDASRRYEETIEEFRSRYRVSDDADLEDKQRANCGWTITSACSP
jgi:hypothetical protein